MKLYPIAVIAGLLPLIAIHLCYWLAASNGHVEWCIPYFHSCTSISAAGRQPPEFYVFKALMIPAAVFIAAYWWYTCQWLTALGCSGKHTRSIVLVIGIVGCLGLVLYSVMLGAIGDLYRLQRRLGVTTFFALTYLAQVAIIHLLGKIAYVREQLRFCYSALKALSLMIFLLGIAALGISAYDEQIYDGVEDAFEWIVTLFLCLQVLIMAVLWRDTDFKTSVSVQHSKFLKKRAAS